MFLNYLHRIFDIMHASCRSRYTSIKVEVAYEYGGVAPFNQSANAAYAHISMQDYKLGNKAMRTELVRLCREQLTPFIILIRASQCWSVSCRTAIIQSMRLSQMNRWFWFFVFFIVYRFSTTQFFKINKHAVHFHRGFDSNFSGYKGNPSCFCWSRCVCIFNFASLCIENL